MKQKIQLLLWTVSWLFLGMILGIFICSRGNETVNEERRPFPKEDIYSDPKHIEKQLTSMDTIFNLAYVTNARSQCMNPGFPSIYITTEKSHNAWLHVIRTDCSHCKYQVFIDSWPEGYPFYTLGSDFSDTPHWSFNFFQRPVSYWIGHAYAVSVDRENKTIECIGGISWGYRLPWWSIWLTMKPVIILPYILALKDWQIDWKIFKEALPEYKNITTID